MIAWGANARALGEIARILRPRGTLVLLWNLPAGRVDPDEERLPLLGNVRSLLTATEYRLPWQTRAFRTRLARPKVERG